MIDLFLLAIGSCCLGKYIEKRKPMVRRLSSDQRIAYNMALFAIIFGFILFGGLRTKFNDTWNYIENFPVGGTNIDFNPMNYLKVPYHGFDQYQRIIKKVFDYNAQWLIMITAIITNVSYIIFYYRYSKTFMLTLLCFIIIGPYTLSCAAIKQILAMTICLPGIKLVLEKKYVKFYLLIFVAYLFHPYIIVMSILPILVDDRVWSVKMLRITVISIICCMLFSQLIGVFLKITEGVGQTYSVEELTNNTINPIRVVVDWIPVIISFKYKNEINAKADRLMVLGINMMVISAIFTFASLFGNPIYIYRTGNYFVSMNAIVVPWMLKECLPRSKWRQLIIVGCYAVYIMVIIYDVTYLNFLKDPFCHTSIMTLFGH